jgi:hypothetical protein
LHAERDNTFDPNAILVIAPSGEGVGHLDERLAGEVTRSLNKGAIWHCYVRRLLKVPGIENHGLTVCLMKLKKETNLGVAQATVLQKTQARRSFMKRLSDRFSRRQSPA